MMNRKNKVGTRLQTSAYFPDMIHEILLSLSGHPSSLLNNNYSSSSSIISPPEKALLTSISQLSDVHCKLQAHTSTIVATHPSIICQSVAIAVRSKHLSRFQQQVLDIEDSLLRKDVSGAREFTILPLTAIVNEFSGWSRIMTWLLEIIEFTIFGCNTASRRCTGAMVIDKLCEAMQTGYVDIKDTALSLAIAAETAWLKQTAAWVLYGRLPSFGREDFFVRTVGSDIQEYEIKRELLPAFVSRLTADSLLFIGRSINHIQSKRSSSTKLPELEILPSHLQQISGLKFPINSTNFSRLVSSIRLSLSQNILKSLLPLARVNLILSLLREIFLLGRGEFAVALVTEADERMRSRWRQTRNLSFEHRDGTTDIFLKEGELSVVLTKTWAALNALQGRLEEYQEDDEILELARDLVRLTTSKSTVTANHLRNPSVELGSKIFSTPFKNLLFSIPTTLTMHIPSPLDLFLTPADIQIYSCINAYLLSIRRAHLRLTDLWKIPAMRRHHPAPYNPPNRNFVKSENLVRERRKKIDQRFSAMRSVWATSSAALFFLAETETYFQGEVVQGIWAGFKNWINGESDSPIENRPASRANEKDGIDYTSPPIRINISTSIEGCQTHDPQSITDAHQRYLSALASSLLLTIPAFTLLIYQFLQQVDHLVALVHRIHSIWHSLDMEAYEGVVDAFSDFHQEERDIKQQLRVVAAGVKTTIEKLIYSLRETDQDKHGWDNGFVPLVLTEENQYVPAKVGRVDRLLMKLDFGGWFAFQKTDIDDISNRSEDE